MAPHIPGAEFTEKMIKKGLQKTVQGTRDVVNNVKETREISSRAKELYDSTKQSLDTQLARTNVMLEILGRTKVNASAKQVREFVDTYGQFKNVEWSGDVDVDKKLIAETVEIEDMRVEAEAAKGLLTTISGSATVGALAGIAAYGGVGAFAAASTGAAISGLHGVAFTNAVLAWFGGGSIATGGLGVAGGTMVLGGIVIVPALAMGAVLIKASTTRALAKVKEYEQAVNKAVEEMNIASDTLVSIFNLAYDYNEFIIAFNERFKGAITSVKEICQAHSGDEDSHVDFGDLNQEERKKLHVAWLMAQIMQALLGRKLVDERCQLDTSAVEYLQQMHEQCRESKLVS